MRTGGPHLTFRAVWRYRADTPADIGPPFLRTLDEFTALSEQFLHWRVVDNEKLILVPCEDVRTDVVGWVTRGASRHAESNEVDPGGGYRIRARSYDASGKSTFEISVCSGEKNYEHLNGFGLSALQRFWPETLSYKDTLRGLEQIVALWKPDDAYAIVYFWDVLPGDERYPYDQLARYPWIWYQSPARRYDARHDVPDLDAQPATDGGRLLIAVGDRFLRHNERHVRRSQILADALRANKIWF